MADEVSTMLDAVTQAQIWRFLVAETQARGIGLVFVSHSHALKSASPPAWWIWWLANVLFG
ncbi:MAG: hypothetical protein ACLSVD_10900 [Eggerthellaceae bacterium]